MKVAILSYSGTVGKTTLAANLLYPRVGKDATFWAVETVNETAENLGIPVQTVRGEQFGQVYKELIVSDNMVVDVGASNIEDFLVAVLKYRGSADEFDYFVIPITDDNKVQLEAVRLVDQLHGIGVPADKIRLVFNNMENVRENCEIIFGHVKQFKRCIANEEAVVFPNEVFNKLSVGQTNVSAVVADTTDYRKLLKDQVKSLREADKSASKKQLEEADEWQSRNELQVMSRGVQEELDAAFAVLFS